MSYCENCGRPVPDGQLLCADCAAATGGQLHTKKGRPVVIILAALAVLFVLFFVLALLFGGKKPMRAGTSLTLTAWQGEDSAPMGDPGPETMTVDAPYAQALRDNPKPEEPAGNRRYEIVVADINWQEACDQAQAAGGHLATITSAEEYKAICQMIEPMLTQIELRYLWLGAQVGEYGWGDGSWITGESWTFDIWYPGEPSGVGSDGEPESVLCMWRVGDGGWTFNDQNPRLVSDYTAGKIGYVIEFEE